jgi:hypothetical protein
MTAGFVKFLKVWLAVLPVWLGLITLGIVMAIVQLGKVSLYDPKVMFTQWAGNYLNIGNTGMDQYFVTHLKDINRHSFAELPKPLFVASSGGVLIPHSDLLKLTWIVPPDVYESAFPAITNQTVSPPSIGAEIEAVYLFPATAKFRSK